MKQSRRSINTRLLPKNLVFHSPILDTKTAEQKIRSLSECFGLSVNPRARINDLAVGARQRVEIIKALYRNAELLILDEPTSVLTPQETRDFFDILKTLVKQGMSVIFITHKLYEVIESGDRATILRNGRVVKTVNVADITQRELAQMMVGRGILECLEKTAQKKGKEILRVEQLSYETNERVSILNDVSLTLHAGEVLGIADTYGLAFYKSQEATQLSLPIDGTVLITIADKDKEGILESAKNFKEMGFKILATKGTKDFLQKNGIESGQGNFARCT
jgi:simple sugar transport system ATP-binding protein